MTRRLQIGVVPKSALRCVELGGRPLYYLVGLGCRMDALVDELRRKQAIQYDPDSSEDLAKVWGTLSDRRRSAAL